MFGVGTGQPHKQIFQNNVAFFNKLIKIVQKSDPIFYNKKFQIC